MRFKSTRAFLVLVAVFAMSAVTATSAFAAGKPLVETKPATGITKSEATLNAVVNPNSAETTYHFEYGTTTSYGKSTRAIYVGSGATSVEEAQKVVGLLADQGYNFRVVATNSNGTTDGSNEAFTTSGPKVPLAETSGASAVTETGATLNGVVNPNGVATKYYFEYGTTISYGKKTAETSAGSGTANLNETATISGLTAKTTYHFRIVAVNANGTTEGADGTFYTEVGPEFNPFHAKREFTGTSGTLVWEWNSGSEKIECSAGTMTGEIASARNVGDVVMKLTGCKSSSSQKSNCSINSNGASAGAITTEPLSGELGTITAGSKVGLRLKAETGKKWFTAAGNACTSEASWTGSVAAEVAPIGVKQTTSKLVFTGSKGTPGITEIKLDSGVAENPALVTFGSEASTATTDSLTFEEAVEVT